VNILAEEVGNLVIHRRPSTPTISINDDEPSVVPTFSFGVEQDDDLPSSPSPLPSAPKQRLHPRNDPSHPSHPLYHPISTLSSVPLSLSLDLICLGCETLIVGRVIMALSKRWHPRCFVCTVEDCQVLLEHIEFAEKDDQPYCKVHHDEVRLRLVFFPSLTRWLTIFLAFSFSPTSAFIVKLQ
jgi:paxillin